MAKITLDILEAQPVGAGVFAWHRTEETRDGKPFAVSYLRVVHNDPASPGTMQTEKGNVTTATLGNKATAGRIIYPSGLSMAPANLGLNVYGPIFDAEGNAMSYPVKVRKE